MTTEIIPPTEKRALVSLYRATAGEMWTHNAGWLEPGSPCAWYGVTCEGGHVTRLDLSDNRLSGTLPEDLGLLTDLTHLDLSGNRLQGLVPPNLGHPRRLRLLDLSRNRLRGPIPPRLQLLVHLRTLDLHANQLSGSIPGALGDLARLEHLDLSDNELTGEVPPELGRLRRLLTLSLSRNPLQGPLPLELSHLTALESFSFAETQLLERSEPTFQAWLRGLPHLESTGVLHAEVVRPGNVALTLLAGAGALGATLASAVLLLPLFGPIASAAAALVGVTGSGWVAKKVYELTEAPTSAAASLPAPVRSALPAPEGLERELRHLTHRARREFPEDVAERVEAIERSLLQILPRLPELGRGDPNAYVVRQTIREYLPEALENYQALPHAFATTEPLRDGKTAHELLLRQLDLLHQAIQKIEAGLPYEDAQQLLIHGRFLEDKFG
ncbi:MAG: hypothetical protein ACP5HM_06170 [Anaerolineae bacterium]